MSTKVTKRGVTASTIDSMLTHQYVTFLNALNKEMDIAYEFEDRSEHIDYYRGMREALSKSAEIFTKLYEDVSRKTSRK